MKRSLVAQDVADFEPLLAWLRAKESAHVTPEVAAVV
jgi:hypothetical protein